MIPENIPDAEEREETIGDLYERMPVNEWREAYGVWWKRLPSPPGDERPAEEPK